MITLLQGILGLIPPEEADSLRHNLHEHDEELWTNTCGGQIGGCRETTWDVMLGVSDLFVILLSLSLPGPIAKFGFAVLNTYRTQFAKLISLLAVLSFLYCASMVFYGRTEDYDLIKRFAWASGKLTVKSDTNTSLLALNWKREEFQLGILSFAYRGDVPSTQA